ncbi:MAG: hypothetical protein ACRD63_07835, partial [Pyrinomonadaceae bacterium]
MEIQSKNRWLLRGAVIGIFLLGYVAGALTLSAYRGWFKTPGSTARQERFEQMVDRLQLNTEQKTRVQQIFSDLRDQLKELRKGNEPRIKEIRQSTNEHLQQVLSPEQWKL